MIKCCYLLCHWINKYKEKEKNDLKSMKHFLNCEDWEDDLCEKRRKKNHRVENLFNVHKTAIIL